MAQNDGATQTVNPAQSPEDSVAKAERELRKAQQKLVDAKDKAKRDEEIDKAVTQYSSDQKSLATKQTELEAKCQSEIGWLALTGAEIDEVKAAREDEQKKVDQTEAEAKQADTKLKQNRIDLDAKKKDRDKAKDAYEALKNQTKRIEARHRAADAIVKEAADARCKGYKLLAYDLLEYNLGKEIGGDPKPIDATSYAAEIRAASDKLVGLDREVADLEKEIKVGETTLADAEKARADSIKAFETTLRARLTTLSQPQPEPEPAS